MYISAIFGLIKLQNKMKITTECPAINNKSYKNYQVQNTKK